MQIEVITALSKVREHDRLFTITLSPEDTLKILDAPGGWPIRETKTMTEFLIMPSPRERTPDEILCTRTDAGYVFYSQTGFKTNEDHLSWLLALGEIPMIETYFIHDERRTIHLGHVQFQRETAAAVACSRDA